MRHSHGLRAASGAAATPDIVTTGLVLNLDAGNASSYPGSGATWTDLSGNGNNATLTNGPTYSSANGGSIVFDGVNDTVSIPSSANQAMGTGDFTFEWWAKTSDATGGYALSASDFLNITHSGGTLYYQGVYGNTTMSFANTTHYNGQWHHHAITRISGTVRWYIDTVQVGTGADALTYTNNNPILLMQGFFGFTAGNMAVWRMYKGKGLTAAEVLQNYLAISTRYVSIVTTGLVLNLDAGNASSYPGSGATWTDLSGNGNNATLTNGPTYSSANGGSIVFDGTNDHALLNTTSVISGDFTVEVWFNQTSYTPSSFASQRCLVGGSNNSSGADNCQFLIDDNGSIPVLALASAAVTLTPVTTGLMILNNWYHIIWTRTGSNITTYLNNVSRSTGTSSAGVRVDRVGQVGTTGSLSKNLPGKISVVRFYNKVLTQAEVTQNFNALRGRYGV